LDPGPLEHREMRYSCTGTLRRVQMVNDGDFVVAVDEIGRRDPAGATPLEVHGADFDRNGNWLVRVSIAVASTETLTALLVLNCWVLFHEAAPPAPETSDEHRIRAQGGFASNQLETYRRYLTLSGADVWQAGQELIVLARQISGAGYLVQALDAQRLTVSALRMSAPDAERRLEYAITFAEQRHNLIVRLIENRQTDEAVALVPETLAGYRDYLAMAGADRWRVAHDLAELSHFLINARRPAESLDIQRACVDVLRSYTATADTALEYVVFFAEQRHNLIFRLHDNTQPEPAVALVAETVSGYLEYAAIDGADLARTRRDLSELANGLVVDGPAAVVQAQQALVDVLRRIVPPPDGLLDHVIMFAEVRRDLILQLLLLGQIDQAVVLVAETVAGFRTYAGLAGADLRRASQALAALSRPLSATGHVNEIVAVEQAIVDILRAFVPAPEDLRGHLISFAEGRHELVCRLRDARQEEPVAALTTETIAGYRKYAVMDGADLPRTRRDLVELVNRLLVAGRAGDAARAQQLVDEIDA
jgi:hypothetical protein